MRISPNGSAHDTSAFSWAKWRLFLLGMVALAGGMLPDLWPYLQLSAQAGQGAPQPPAAENSIYRFGPPHSSYTAPPGNSVLVSFAADGLANVSSPFPIRFYGDSYTPLTVALDGFIRFGTGYPSPFARRITCTPWTDSLPQSRALMAFHADWAIGTGAVRHWTIGIAPNRVFTIDWTNVRLAADATKVATFQVQFFENGNPIVVRFGSFPLFTPPVVAPNDAGWMSGTDAGDGANATLHHGCGTAAVPANFGFSLIETAGPTTRTEIVADPAVPVIGETVAVQVQVTAGNDPVHGGGAVTLWQGNLSSSAPLDAFGRATFSYIFDSISPRTFDAAFTPGIAPVYSPSNGSATIAPVFAVATATTLSSDISPAIPAPGNREVTLIADVTADGRVVSAGSVRFTEGATLRGVAAVTNGQARLRVVLAEGDHTITAGYTPATALVVPSSDTRTISIGSPAAVSVHPFVLDNQWLVATVAAPGVTSGGGTMTFSVDSKPVGTAQVYPLNATAAIAVMPAPPMPYPADGSFVSPSVSYDVMAEYSGSPASPAGAGRRSVTFTKQPTALTFQSSPPPTVLTSSTTLSSGSGMLVASVSFQSGTTPAGSVLFLVDGVPVAIKSVEPFGTTGIGRASIPAPAAYGAVRAAYLGHAVSATAYVAVSSATLGGVTKKATTTSVSLGIGTTLGQAVWTLRARVTDALTGLPVTGGNVTASSTSIAPVTAPLIDGVAELTFTTTSATGGAAGAVVLSALAAAFNGNDTHSSSTAPAVNVRGYSTAITATAITDAPPNERYTVFDATVRWQYATTAIALAGFDGSLQVRNAQGAALLSDEALGGLSQLPVMRRISISRPEAQVAVAFSGALRSSGANAYEALLPSAQVISHDRAQSRMTRLPGESAYEWITLSPGAPLFPRCDDCFAAVTANDVPGATIPWQVRFDSKLYSTIYVGNNGVISFTQGVSSYMPQCPPLAPPMGPMLAGFWADHDTRLTTTGGQLKFQVVGTAPHRIAVFEWDSVNFYPTQYDSPLTPSSVEDRSSFQMHLFEDNRPPRTAIRTGPIVSGSASFGQAPTIGVDYGDGLKADLVQCGLTSSPGVRRYTNEAFDFRLVLTTTDLSLTSSTQPAIAGEPFTLTGRVDAGDVPVGTLRLTMTTPSNTTTELLSQPVPPSGEVFVSPVLFEPGNYSFTLQYASSPLDPFSNASASLVLPVVPAPTTRVALNVTPETSVYGAPVTLTADVTEMTGGAAVAGAQVVFKVGTQIVGTAITAANGRATATVSGTPAGLHAASATAAHDGDMTVEAIKPMIVTQRPAQLVAPSFSVAYGAPTPAPPYAFTVQPLSGDPHSGLALNESAGAITGVTFAINRTPSSPAGAYPIVPTVPAQMNYVIMPIDGVLTVTQAGLTVTANNRAQSYGTPAPVLSPLADVTYVGFVGADDAGDLDVLPTVSTNVTALSPVGQYPITVCCGSDDSYALGFVDGTLNVTPALLTVAANPATKVYGAPLPPLKASYYGFVNNESPADLDQPMHLTTNASASSPAGSYVINVTGGADANYTINRSPATLTVTRAPLTITANSFSKKYGAPLPPFSATFTGFTNGDDEASLDLPVSYNSSVGLLSPVGTYPLLPFGAQDANYNILFAAGSINVTPGALTLVVDPKSRNYGDPNPPLTGTLTGALDNDGITAAYAANVSTTAPVGDYPITGSLVDPLNRLGNYVTSITNALLTVKQRALTVTAFDYTRPYGQPNPPMNVSVSGVAPGDGITATAAVAANVSSPVGTYPIKITLHDPNNRLGNYDVTLNDGTLTVSAATLTVTAGNAARAYGAPDPPFSGSVVGARDEDLITATFKANATPASPIGHYPIVPTLLDPNGRLGNYVVALQNGSLNITPAALHVSADSAARDYGRPNPPFTGTITGLVNGDNVSASYASNTTPATPIGVYPIVPKLFDPAGALANYFVTSENGLLTIERAALHVEAFDGARKYGAANPPFSGSITGVAPGDDISANFSSNTSPATPVGEYPIVPQLLDPAHKLANYLVTTKYGVLTIGKAALTIAAEYKTTTYGADAPPLTVSYAGFVNGETADVLLTPPAITTSYAKPNGAGTYPIKVSGATARNYDITFVGGDLTVETAALSIIAEDRSMTYGSAVPLLTMRFEGFVNGDTAADLVTPATVTTAATPASPVGSYPIVASGAASPNYRIAFVNGALTIDRAALSAVANNAARTYGGTNPVFTGTLAGVQNNDPITVTYSTAATAASATGEYAITPRLDDPANKLGNYMVTLTDGTLTIGRAALTVTASDTSKTYGQPNPVLTGTIDGIVNGDTITASYATTATAGSDAGGYPITPSLNDPAGRLGNYDVAINPATLTITPAALTITADNKTKVYGAAMPPLTATYAGFVNGDDEWSLATPLALATDATAGSDTGEYAITATGASDPNYTITLVNGALSITRAPLTITAADAAKTYGAALPPFAAAFDGFVNGDTAAALDVPVTFTTAATAASATGTYAITPGGAADSNYAIAFADGALTVTPASLTITADPVTKVYGAALPVLTASFAGFVNGDTAASLDTAVTLTTTATAASAVGEYAIAPTDASDPNYTISFVNGTLTVTRAPLTITADDQARGYGASNPALTASYAGFVNGETAASLTTPVSIATPATVASAVGTYPIVPSAADSPNYAITFVPGTLTVVKAALTVKADAVTKLLGAPLPSFTASYSGFLNGDTPASLGGVLSFATPATAASSVGTYDVTPSGATSPNYMLQFEPGTLTITYNVCQVSDAAKPSGGSERVLLQLCNAAGANASASGVTLRAVRVQTPAGAPVGPAVGSGQSSDGLFRFGSLPGGRDGYIFQLRTQGMAPGTYDLQFTADGDPLPHTARFTVR